MIENLHFLRPIVLLLLLPASIIFWLMFKFQGSNKLWSSVISPHLLEHITLQGETKTRRLPAIAYIGGATIGILAAAGPSYQKEESPFAEDQAALVIVLENTPSMTAQDIQPSRLQRATQKIKDLLALRPGTETALITYSGSAHTVMPITADNSIVGTFAAELSPEIMPKKGDDLNSALTSAQKLLLEAGKSGSILLISDNIPEASLQSLRSKPMAYPVLIYPLVAPKGTVAPLKSPPVIPLNEKSLYEFINLTDATLISLTPDQSDLQTLTDEIETSLQNSLKEGGTRWQDSGYWLMPFMALICLLWFRKGWQVEYE